MNFQDVISNLQRFWADQGCAAISYDMEVGAGTFNPSTFCGCSVGTESGYPESSRRPTDGRYGENPNRLQHYFQFQVILKPSPNNAGSHLTVWACWASTSILHDIRFVRTVGKSHFGRLGLG